MIKIETKYELEYWINRLEYAESLVESIGRNIPMIGHAVDNVEYADSMIVALRLRATPDLLNNIKQDGHI